MLRRTLADDQHDTVGGETHPAFLFADSLHRGMHAQLAVVWRGNRDKLESGASKANETTVRFR